MRRFACQVRFDDSSYRTWLCMRDSPFIKSRKDFLDEGVAARMLLVCVSAGVVPAPGCMKVREKGGKGMIHPIGKRCGCAVGALFTASLFWTVAGCGSAQVAHDSVMSSEALLRPSGAPQGTRALAGWGLAIDEAIPESARNDGHFGVRTRAGAPFHSSYEVRTYDTRTTVNGRIREYSRTTVRETHRTGGTAPGTPR